MTTNNEVGLLSDAIIDAGLKKSQLARIMGVDPATVSRWGEYPPKYVWAYLHEKRKVREAERRVRQIIDALDQALGQWK